MTFFPLKLQALMSYYLMMHHWHSHSVHTVHVLYTHYDCSQTLQCLVNAVIVLFFCLITVINNEYLMLWIEKSFCRVAHLINTWIVGSMLINGWSDFKPIAIEPSEILSPLSKCTATITTTTTTTVTVIIYSLAICV